MFDVSQGVQEFVDASVPLAALALAFLIIRITIKVWKRLYGTMGS